MEKQAPLKPPFFDPTQLRKDLTELWRTHQKQESTLRQELLKKLIDLKTHAHKHAEINLLETGDGRLCAEGLSKFQDELIRILYDFTTKHIYRAHNPSAAERIAIIATGGYGRGALAPGSDIDLLFLLPYKQTAWGESVVEYMLYILWDMGFKVGHATRSIEQSILFAKSDMTIRTSLLDSRFLWGEEHLYETFLIEFNDKVINGTAREFIEAKLEERDERHQRSGSSRYMVEPNVKDGKGGQRDLHTLHWLAKYLNFNNNDNDISNSGVFTFEEYHSFKHCDNFLWTIRCHLHFLTNRAEERISFDVQKSMAERLGYTDRKGLKAVERFMKHYFLNAKEVGNLTRILCADLEMKQLKATPKLNEIIEGLGWRKRRTLRKSTDFRIENGRINTIHRDTFKRDPANLIRIFALASEYNTLLHPTALRQIRRSLRLLDKKLRNDKTANRLFLEILVTKDHPEKVISRMNESGVLGRFIRDFGKIVSMMQFNMYHHFTVDEHLIHSLRELAAIERGEVQESLPLSHDLIQNIKNRRALYVAVFIHDIAKGRKEDHSIAGARIAKRLGLRFGLSQEETDLVSWLILEHLTMSSYAQSRDLNDPQTIKDFCDIVQTRERLNLLTILTVCDIRAVGPGTWNGWKGQLLRTLYAEASQHLSDGENEDTQNQQVTAAIADFKQKIKSDGFIDWDDKRLEEYSNGHFPAYWLKTDLEHQIIHANLVNIAEQENQQFSYQVTSDAFTAHTSITIYTPTHPKLLSMLAGSCASTGANIIDAQVNTTQNGMALDSICISREFDHIDDEKRRAKNIAETMEKLIRGEMHLDQLMKKSPALKGRITAFDVMPDVKIDNGLSNEFTVIEMRGLDRTGLLFNLTEAIGDLNLDISSAHIATYGEKAIDVFYVTDLLGDKIINKGRQQQIIEALVKVLADAES